VSFWDYLRDRLTGAGQVPRLSELIRRRAKEWHGKKKGAAAPA